MSELDDLRKQVEALAARLAHFEQHHTAQPPIQAGPKPNGALTAKLDAAYERNKPRLQRWLISALSDKYHLLSSGAHDLANLTFDGSQRIELAELPRAIAAGFTRETMTREEIKSTRQASELTGADNNHKLTRLEVELAALSRHTDDLVASTELPPVPEALARKAGLPALGHASAVGCGVAVAGWVQPR